jgi:hypothetical protein
MESRRQHDQVLLKDPDFTKKMHFVYFAKTFNLLKPTGYVMHQQV